MDVTCNDWRYFTRLDQAANLEKLLVELKISVRCLATTLWFFCSQMCTFLPGIILMGCDQVDDSQSPQQVRPMTSFFI